MSSMNSRFPQRVAPNIATPAAPTGDVDMDSSGQNERDRRIGPSRYIQGNEWVLLRRATRHATRRRRHERRREALMDVLRWIVTVIVGLPTVGVVVWILWWGAAEDLLVGLALLGFAAC